MGVTRTDDRTVLRNHWVPRPGWSPGRSLLACYLALDTYPQVTEHLVRHQDMLGDLAQIDLVPVPWMHVTVQGIAFLDELPADSMSELADALREPLALLEAPRVRLGLPEPGGEGMFFPLTPRGRLSEMRDQIRETAMKVLELPLLYGLPGQDQDFCPHASFAYANSDMAVQEVMSRLADVTRPPVEIAVTSVSVIALRQSDRRWWWGDRRDVPVGDAR